MIVILFISNTQISFHLFILLTRDCLDHWTRKNVKEYDRGVFELYTGVYDNPLDLSISLKGGEENNNDFFSSGE